MIENVAKFLDAPGEYFFDAKAKRVSLGNCPRRQHATRGKLARRPQGVPSRDMASCRGVSRDDAPTKTTYSPGTSPHRSLSASKTESPLAAGGAFPFLPMYYRAGWCESSDKSPRSGVK